MLLSKSGQYALQAMLQIASAPDGQPMRTNQIAEALDVPANTLSKVLSRLARAAVLRSLRGPQGGFALAFPADELTLAEALAPIESERLERRCLLGRARCSDANPCAAHDRWSALVDHIDDFLGDTTLANVVVAASPSSRGRRKAATRKPSRRSR